MEGWRFIYVQRHPTLLMTRGASSLHRPMGKEPVGQNFLPSTKSETFGTGWTRLFNKANARPATLATVDKLDASRFKSEANGSQVVGNRRP
jgi:hypothetical protein